MFAAPFLSLLLCVSRALGDLSSLQSSDVKYPREQAVLVVHETELPPPNNTYYFDQLIDHNNPGLDTFRQRYWHNWGFYEKGGLHPVTRFSDAQ